MKYGDGGKGKHSGYVHVPNKTKGSGKAGGGAQVISETVHRGSSTARPEAGKGKSK